jgi:hypothetical protein
VSGSPGDYGFLGDPFFLEEDDRLPVDARDEGVVATVDRCGVRAEAADLVAAGVLDAAVTCF